MKKYLTAIVAAVIVIGLVLVGFTYLNEVYATTAGVAYNTHGVKGNSAAGGAPNGDLLDTDTYITGWTGNADSEKIVVQGQFSLTADAPGEVVVKRTWYQVTLEGTGPNVKINGVPGTTFITNKSVAPAQDVMPDRYYTMPAFTFKLTNTFIGKVHVEFWADRQWNFGLSGGAAMLSSDEAYLKSGVGRVHLTADVWEEGTEAIFQVETGFAHTAKDGVSATDQGWYLNIYNPEGTQVFTKTLSDNFNGEVKWLIPTGSYKAEWSNKFAVVLRNELIDQDQRVVYAVGPGMLLKKPNQPTATLIEGTEPFSKGETITIRLSAEMNPLGFPIAGFTVSIVATSATGAVTDYVMKDRFIAAQKDNVNASIYWGEVTFAFPEAGYAELWGNTVDTKNLNSGNTVLTFSVQGMDEPPPPGGDEGIDTSVIIAVVLVVAAFMLAMMMLVFRPLPFAIYIGLGLIVAGVVGLWYIVAVML